MTGPMMESVREACVMLVGSGQGDGQGGCARTWTDGVGFDAWFEPQKSEAGRAAEKPEVKSVYAVYLPRDVAVAPFDAFRRVCDGAVFRVISDGADSKTPPTAALDMRRVKAERWVLPT